MDQERVAERKGENRWGERGGEVTDNVAESAGTERCCWRPGELETVFGQRSWPLPRDTCQNGPREPPRLNSVDQHFLAKASRELFAEPFPGRLRLAHLSRPPPSGWEGAHRRADAEGSTSGRENSGPRTLPG